MQSEFICHNACNCTPEVCRENNGYVRCGCAMKEGILNTGEVCPRCDGTTWVKKDSCAAPGGCGHHMCE